MTRADVCRTIEQIGIVPVIRAPSPELAIRAAEAILAGGIPIFEITMTVPDAIAVIRSLRDRFGDRALVGAGTVLTAESARACIDAGAAFVVSPGLDLATIEAAHSRDVPILPGALTPTEVITASQAGADMVKIFPCSAVGGREVSACATRAAATREVSAHRRRQCLDRCRVHRGRSVRPWRRFRTGRHGRAAIRPGRDADRARARIACGGSLRPRPDGLGRVAQQANLTNKGPSRDTDVPPRTVGGRVSAPSVYPVSIRCCPGRVPERAWRRLERRRWGYRGRDQNAPPSRWMARDEVEARTRDPFPSRAVPAEARSDGAAARSPVDAARSVAGIRSAPAAKRESPKFAEEEPPVQLALGESPKPAEEETPVPQAPGGRPKFAEEATPV